MQKQRHVGWMQRLSIWGRGTERKNDTAEEKRGKRQNGGKVWEADKGKKAKEKKDKKENIGMVNMRELEAREKGYNNCKLFR